MIVNAKDEFKKLLEYNLPSLTVNPGRVHRISRFNASPISPRDEEGQHFQREFVTRFGPCKNYDHCHVAALTLLKEYGVLRPQSQLRGNALKIAMLGHLSPLYRLKRHIKLFEKKGDKRSNNIAQSILQDMVKQQEEYNDISLGDIVYYRRLCSFNLTAEIFPDIKGYELLQERGWYHPQTNINGVVKDHRLSIYDGYHQKISPSIVGNPMNCEFLTVRDNSRKSSNSSIALEDLKDTIKNYFA